MALKLKLTKEEYDKLDEGIRGLYGEQDGGYVLSVEGIEDTTGLKNALAAERKEREKYAKLAKTYEGLGKTPDEIQEILKKMAEDEENTLAKKGEFEKLKAQLLEQHKKELDAKDHELLGMKSSLESYLVDTTATKAIAENNGNVTLLLPHVKSRVRVVNDNGKYSTQVLLPDGSAPMLNAKGEPVSIADFVKAMRDDEVFQPAFKSSGNTGSGGAGGGGGSKPYVITRADAKDNRKYMAAKEAAEKAGQTLEISD